MAGEGISKLAWDYGSKAEGETVDDCPATSR